MTAPTAVAATATDVHPGPEQPTATLPPDPATYTPEPREPKGPSLFVPVAAAIVGLIGLTAVVLSVFGIDVTAVAVAIVAGSAAVISAGVAIARFGQRGTVPLLILGALFAVIATFTTIGRDEFDRGIGYQEFDPVTAAELERATTTASGSWRSISATWLCRPARRRCPSTSAGARLRSAFPTISRWSRRATGSRPGRQPGSAARCGDHAWARRKDSKVEPPEPPVLVIDAEVGIGAIELARGDERAFDRGPGG